nr:reverse transcriptase domain-containing protein [Tanacetum cinerariifolium]
MPPRMRSRSAGRPDAKSLGGGTGGRVGRGGGRGRRPREEGVNRNVEEANGGAPEFSTIIAQQLQNLLPAMLAHVSNRGNFRNQNGNVVNENVQENVGNVLVNGNQLGCSYQEFLAYKPKEYDGKDGAVVLTRWIKKMESVHDMSGCSIDQKVKCTADLFVGKDLTWWNSQIRMLSQEVVVSMSWNDFKFLMIEEFCPSHEMQYKDKIGRDDNKRTRTDNDFATTVNPIGRENTGTWPKCATCNSYHAPGGPCCTCFNCNRLGHLEKDCRSVPRNVNPVNIRNPTVRVRYECGSANHVRSACHGLNRAQGPEGNRPNQVAANNGGQGRGNQGNQARGIEPNDLGIRYEIEITSGSFDVILGMDWLSNHKAEIICHEKVVRIPLLDGKVLRVLGEKLGEKARILTSAKARDKKQKEIVVARDFLEHCRSVPRNVNLVNIRNPTVRVRYECGSADHVRSACPRLNRAQGPEGNRPNQVAANNGGQGRGNQGNQARGRAFMLGAEEAR